MADLWLTKMIRVEERSEGGRLEKRMRLANGRSRRQALHQKQVQACHDVVPAADHPRNEWHDRQEKLDPSRKPGDLVKQGQEADQPANHVCPTLTTTADPVRAPETSTLEVGTTRSV